jgi:hypothetical protein
LTNKVGQHAGHENGSDGYGFSWWINCMDDGGLGNFLYGDELDERGPRQF